MSDDIIERLRDEARFGRHISANRQMDTRDLHREAADEIEALRHDLSRHIEIASELATETERLRALLDAVEGKQDNSSPAVAAPLPPSADNPMAWQGWSDDEERIGWAIFAALHESVPEEKRPTSWMDLNGEQLPRIRSAAQAAIRAGKQDKGCDAGAVAFDAGHTAPAALNAEISELRGALASAYIYITQPRRMTPGEAAYDTRTYNALVEKLRAALGNERT